MSSSEVILDTSEDGRMCLKLNMLENTVWRTQLEIAELFGKGRSTIAEHINAIFDDGELESASVCRKFRQTADDGKFYKITAWEEKLDAFLLFKERDLLDHASNVSAQVAKKLALECYDEFSEIRLKAEKLIADDEDRAVLEELQTVANSVETSLSKP